MNADELRGLLEKVRAGALGVDGALSALESLPFAELGYAKVDHHRTLRLGFPEVVLGDGKRPEQIIGIARRLLEARENVFVTRVRPEVSLEVRAALSELVYEPLSRTLSYEHGPIPQVQCEPVAVVSAGTSDIPVAEEALQTLRICGIPAVRVFDVGVAGIHRLFGSMDPLARAPAVIVVAGMEGALPSVVGGLIGTPVIAVPTSVGYGTALSGFTALLGMLTSCASGVTVVNIDNGFGAAVAVARMLRRANRT
ncbi:MAG TPA: nickel pincer cofactor biosynthesis protein LarB [Polyangiaceae bacterium]|jgi:NCAIR mutase (PurE)-related protein|nr:nickel pincer cofactor biosynthesis protein LarB [Polyangiaceae bacterium]